jgi:hypothetical protein
MRVVNSVLCAVIVAAAAVASGHAQPQRSATGTLTILFHSDPGHAEELKEPALLKAGDNTFEVLVKDGDKTVDNADVTLTMHRLQGVTPRLPAIPLKHYGDGVYRGKGVIPTAGSWGLKISVKKNGVEIGSREITATVNAK